MQAPSLITALSLTEAVTSTTAPINVQQVDRIALQVNATDATPGAQSFVAANVSAANDTITITAHGFVTGLKAPLTGTNLPGGLSATNYWIIVVDANTVKLATSYANAIAGTAVDITSAGSTTDAALTPSSFGSATIGMKASLDGVNFFAFATPKTFTITGTGNQYLDCGQCTYPWVQIYYTAQVAGALTATVLLYGVNTQVSVHN